MFRVLAFYAGRFGGVSAPQPTVVVPYGGIGAMWFFHWTGGGKKHR